MNPQIETDCNSGDFHDAIDSVALPVFLIGTLGNACCAARSMRRVCLTGSFFALGVLLCSLWAFRFERVPALPTWRLADLQAVAPPMPGVEWTGTPDRPGLRLRVDAANSPVAVRLAIPGIAAVQGLHLRFRMSSRGLTAGQETWEDGRLMIEWALPDGEAGLTKDPVGSIRDDTVGSLEDFVVLSGEGLAMPSLRLEHLGRAGEFELSDLEITAVAERPSWKIGKWLLLGGWLAWGTAFVRSWPGIRWWRAIAAAAIWLLMGIHFVIPGPWRIQRAIYPNFQIGGEPTGHAVASPPEGSAETGKQAPSVQSGPVRSLGKMPDQGSFVLQVKLRASQARPLLHALLLFAPTLVIALLVGRSPALRLVAGLALAIELAQLAFGYGFDWIDLFDLAFDAAGIALGIWLSGRIRKRWRPPHGGPSGEGASAA